MATKKPSQIEIRDAYREYYQQQFGTLNQLTDRYGYGLYDHLNKGGTLKDFAPQSFGVAEFKVICDKDKVQLIIHDDQVVAESHNNVYSDLFDYCVKKLGGRKDEKAS